MYKASGEIIAVLYREGYTVIVADGETYYGHFDQFTDKQACLRKGMFVDFQHSGEAKPGKKVRATRIEIERASAKEVA